MNLQRLIDHTLAIQAIPAPTFSEDERAAYLHHAFMEAGAPQVEIDAMGNVFARVPGGDRPPLVISAHLDSVFPRGSDLSSNINGGRLIGPGIGDNAVALATLLELTTDLCNRPLAGEVWLIANVGEEGLGNLRGMQEVVARFENRVSAYLVLEGMALGHIYHRGLPVRRLRIEVQTQGGHSWIHAGRPSAIHALIQLGEKLLAFELPGMPRTTLNIGTLEGGTSINSIADRASCEIDLRSESETEVEALQKKVQALVKRHASSDLTIRCRVIGVRPGGGIPADHPLVQLAEEIYRSLGGAQVKTEAASTDASVPLSRGYPALCVGITHGGGAHSLEEYIEVEPIEHGYAALFSLVEQIFEQLP